MKKLLLSIILIIYTLLSFGCNTNYSEVNVSTSDSVESVSDSITDLALYNHYLYLYSISNGFYWHDETYDKNFFYRLLFSSVGEEAYIDIELIEILEEDNLKLVSRRKLKPEIFNLEYFPLRPNFVLWKSPKEIVVKIDQNQYILDLGNMSATIIE